MVGSGNVAVFAVPTGITWWVFDQFGVWDWDADLASLVAVAHWMVLSSLLVLLGEPGERVSTQSSAASIGTVTSREPPPRTQLHRIRWTNGRERPSAASMRRRMSPLPLSEKGSQLSMLRMSLSTRRHPPHEVRPAGGPCDEPNHPRLSKARPGETASLNPGRLAHGVRSGARGPVCQCVTPPLSPCQWCSAVAVLRLGARRLQGTEEADVRRRGAALASDRLAASTSPS